MEGSPDEPSGPVFPRQVEQERGPRVPGRVPLERAVLGDVRAEGVIRLNLDYPRVLALTGPYVRDVFVDVRRLEVAAHVGLDGPPLEGESLGQPLDTPVV